MKNILFLLGSMPFFLSCNSAGNKLFASKKTPHEAYAASIKDQQAATQWLNISKAIMVSPQTVALPYRQLGYFPGDKPRALSLQFNAARGEQILIRVTSADSNSVELYADLFVQHETALVPVEAMDKEDMNIDVNVDEAGVYTLRIQPALSSRGYYNLSIEKGPSLGFPVAGTKARVGSVWGDSRDNGERSHEGIDIFAAKLTPAIAAADGYISSVKDGGLGGKTVNLKVEGRNLSLYYAHLDQQLVTQGQRVQKGDTLGLVGNTGNARTTPPHLHFGIYTYNGAIDPLPFVNRIQKTVPAITKKDMSRPLQLVKALPSKNNNTIAANSLIIPLALTSSGYLAETQDGTIVEVGFKQVKPSTGKSSS